MIKSNERTFLGHPIGLFVLFFTEMGERFSFYGMKAILFLYLIKGIESGALGLPEDLAGAIFGLYAAAVYILTLPGGWIADSIIGQKKAIWWGGIIIMIGHILLAIPGSNIYFYSGLTAVALGTGLLKANISSIVGDLYPEGGAKRDSAFSIFYMGINSGALLGMLIVGYLGEKVGWHYGFGAAAFAMFFGLVVFKTFGKELSHVGHEPEVKAKPTFLFVLLGILLALFAVIYFNVIDVIQLTNSMKYAVPALTVLYFIYIGFFDSSLTLSERKRVAVLFVFFVGAAVFWSGFEQSSTTLTIFAERYTDRTMFGWEMPASWLQSANSMFILIFSAVFAALWIFLSKKKLNPSTPLKFGLGLFNLALAFLVLYFASELVVKGNLAHVGWLLLTYLLFTLGELCVSPVGLSTYTKLAPRKYYSQMMGLWFVAASLGNLIAGLFAGNFKPDAVNEMPGLFLQVCLISVGVGLILSVFSNPIKKWMGGIE
jgi:POT family proton-dependent oligopeptide transporter